MCYIIVADCMCLAYLHSAWRGELPKLTEVARDSEIYALRGFRFIRVHRIWHLSNEHIRLPITDYFTRFPSFGDVNGKNCISDTPHNSVSYNAVASDNPLRIC